MWSTKLHSDNYQFYKWLVLLHQEPSSCSSHTLPNRLLRPVKELESLTLRLKFWCTHWANQACRVNVCVWYQWVCGSVFECDVWCVWESVVCVLSVCMCVNVMYWVFECVSVACGVSVCECDVGCVCVLMWCMRVCGVWKCVWCVEVWEMSVCMCVNVMCCVWMCVCHSCVSVWCNCVNVICGVCECVVWKCVLSESVWCVEVCVVSVCMWCLVCGYVSVCLYVWLPDPPWPNLTSLWPHSSCQQQPTSRTPGRVILRIACIMHYA